MGKMERYSGGFPGTTEVYGPGLSEESTRDSKKQPFYGYDFIDNLIGNKPPYNQTGA